MNTSANLYNESRQGIVVAPHAQAAEAGAAALAEGGNAIEACVAMAATLAAVYPHMTGLGGDSFWLLHHPGKQVQSVFGCGRSGANVTREAYTRKGLQQIPYRGGNAAITVAGTVSGWQQALTISNQEWGGKLPLSRLVSDAIGYCREGYAVTASQAIATRGKFDQLISQPGFADVFLVDGKPPLAGDQLTQSALGATLEQLTRAGLDDFYRGELAEVIAQDLNNADSPLTHDDLVSHHAQLMQPISLRTANAEVFTTTAPTQGAATLMILGQFMRRPAGVATEEDADTVHWLVEATKQAFKVRNQSVRDPALMAEPTQSLLENSRLDALAEKIDSEHASPWGEATSPADTTWFGAIDAEGRSVSCIQSIYHEFGSGVVLPNTGVCWQNRGASFSLQPGHPLELTPNSLPFHTLCPSMAHFDDGRRMVFGTMGGDGQPQTQAILFTRYADYQQLLQQAVAAPRWVLGRTWGDHSDNLKMESRFDPAVISTLRKRGHDIAMLGDYDETVGHAGAIVRHPDGRLEGASDPRSDGAAMPVDRQLGS
jgi:gamma-glutamyltranspeptidase/glutathione hydrolase